MAQIPVAPHGAGVRERFGGLEGVAPSPALLAAQQVLPFVFTHYTPPAAYRQKINALATRTHMQARDVFDLHHLSRYAAAGQEAPPALVARAMAQLRRIGFDMFNDQVVPFLPADLAAHYGTPAAWKAMGDKVWSDLSAARSPSTS